MSDLSEIVKVRAGKVDLSPCKVWPVASRQDEGTSADAPAIISPGAFGSPPVEQLEASAPPALTGSPPELGAARNEAAPLSSSRNVLGLAAACAGHALLVFSLFYAVGTAGLHGVPQENPIEIEIVVEPSPQAAPAINIELPPPLPDPVIDPPESDPIPEPAPKIVVELPPPLPEPVIEPPSTEPVPEPAFEPPPETKSEPTLVVPKTVPPPRDRERERRLRERRQQALAKAREQARLKEREKSRRAARPVTRQTVSSPASAPQAARAGNPSSIAAFRAAVAARIARNRPSTSLAAQAQGTVVIAFTVTASGSASGVRVARSSGHGLLDNAALAAVRRASPFPPPPPGAPRTFSVPMRFNTR